MVTGSATESISEDGLNDQIEDHLRSSAVELSAKVGLRLQTIEDSVVKFMAGVHGETFLGNDVLAVPDPDFFYNDSFSVGELDRFEIDEEATLDHSIWYQRSDATPEPADLHNVSLSLYAYSLLDKIKLSLCENVYLPRSDQGFEFQDALFLPQLVEEP